MKLVEIAPGRWRLDKPALRPARSDLPLPYVISDIMEPTEQVDGRFYTSKREFRAVGRAHGLTEIGNEKLPRIVRSTDKKTVKTARRDSLKTAIEKYKAGHRPGGKRI
jgi:hypothetical protein